MSHQVIVKPQPKLFLVIGCGGIGGNLLRDIPKLLIGYDKSKLMLIDGDHVDDNNLKRQPFQSQDLNKNKARALACKLNSFYDVNAMYYDKYLLANELDDICKKYPNHLPVFLGCVDNDATRKIIEENFLKQKDAVYIDGANSVHEGNVFVVCKKDNELIGQLRSSTYEFEKDINPGLQSCEDAVASGNTQILVTNSKIAITMLEHVYTIMSGEVKVGVTDVSRFKIIHY